MEQCCGTCKFHCTDDTGEWVCANDLSEYYALETEYGDTCDDWCGRKLDWGDYPRDRKEIQWLKSKQ